VACCLHFDTKLQILKLLLCVINVIINSVNVNIRNHFKIVNNLQLTIRLYAINLIYPQTLCNATECSPHCVAVHGGQQQIEIVFNKGFLFSNFYGRVVTLALFRGALYRS
jgi:hypothetical protein